MLYLNREVSGHSMRSVGIALRIMKVWLEAMEWSHFLQWTGLFFVIFFFFLRFIDWFESLSYKREGEPGREVFHSLVRSHKCPQWSALRQAKSSSQELCPGPLHGWQGPKHMNHLLFSQNQKYSPRMYEPAPIQDDHGFTFCSTTLSPTSGS